MALLTLRRKQMFRIGIPYWVFINGQPIGVMRNREVSINMPRGTYSIGVKMVFMLFRWRFSLGSEQQVTLGDNERTELLITDRERWWNIAFNIDLQVWIASMFLTLPSPWSLIYHIVSEGFFALWLLRIYIIRNRYFKLTPCQRK